MGRALIKAEREVGLEAFDFSLFMFEIILIVINAKGREGKKVRAISI